MPSLGRGGRRCPLTWPTCLSVCHGFQDPPREGTGLHGDNACCSLQGTTRDLLVASGSLCVVESVSEMHDFLYATVPLLSYCLLPPTFTDRGFMRPAHRSQDSPGVLGHADVGNTAHGAPSAHSVPLSDNSASQEASPVPTCMTLWFHIYFHRPCPIISSL